MPLSIPRSVVIDLGLKAQIYLCQRSGLPFDPQSFLESFETLHVMGNVARKAKKKLCSFGSKDDNISVRGHSDMCWTKPTLGQSVRKNRQALPRRSIRNDVPHWILVHTRIGVGKNRCGSRIKFYIRRMEIFWSTRIDHSLSIRKPTGIGPYGS